MIPKEPTKFKGKYCTSSQYTHTWDNKNVNALNVKIVKSFKIIVADETKIYRGIVFFFNFKWIHSTATKQAPSLHIHQSI
jgi:hypothetical protein